MKGSVIEREALYISNYKFGQRHSNNGHKNGGEQRIRVEHNCKDVSTL